MSNLSKTIAIILLLIIVIGIVYSSEEPIEQNPEVPDTQPTATAPIVTDTPPVTDTPAVTETQPSPTVTATPIVTDPIPEGTIKLAAFNIQVFGKTKAGKPEVMEIISKTIRNFDIVAVQEIRDSSQTALPALKDAVNEIGDPKYDFIVGERLGRTTSKEQYAYVYNTERIEVVGEPFTYPDPTDIFHREPYIANFNVKDGNFDFVLMTIHTDPDEATEEIDNLTLVIDEAKNRYQDEGDFIVMGDFNADCSYFDEDGSSPLKESEYLWLIDNSLDTTTKSTVCTYDRIVITTPATTDYTGDSGVYRYDLVYNLTEDMTTAVSDHYPVYAEFWDNQDTD